MFLVEFSEYVCDKRTGRRAGNFFAPYYALSSPREVANRAMKIFPGGLEDRDEVCPVTAITEENFFAFARMTPVSRRLATLAEYLIDEGLVDLNRLVADMARMIEKSPGSRAAHQARPGGFLDHVLDTIALGEKILSFRYTSRLQRSSLIKVMVLHDIHKPWKYVRGVDVDPRELIERYSISLTSDEENALRYIHGEGEDYVAGERVMCELAGLCHAVDVLSARVWWK